ncbi:MAG: LAGLIDADG family homing endonuclease [Pseudomonadota bacterium]
MKLQEKAYIAGIIDGEGTVTLTRKHKNETPTPVISIANNSLELLKWLKVKLCTGTITKRTKRKAHHNQAFVYEIRDDKALKFLAEIKDLLIIKKPHAKLLIDCYKKVTPRNGKYTKEMMAKKMKLVAEIRRLNKR